MAHTYEWLTVLRPYQNPLLQVYLLDLIVDLLYYIPYSTSEPPTLPNRSKHAKPLLSTLYPLCLNYLTYFRLNTKVDFSLLLKPIDLANVKATRLLLLPTTLNTEFLINALVEYYFALKYS